MKALKCLALVSALALTGLAACHSHGPYERAADRLEDAADEVREKGER